MKDYRLKKSEQLDYIVEVRPSEAFTLDGQDEAYEAFEVKFADGRVFKNILVDKENVAKVIQKQEEQAKAGVANLPVFERRKTLGGVMTGAAIIGGPLVATAGMTAIENASTAGNDPLSFAIGVGVVTLGCLIPGVYSLIKNAPKVSELRKIKYRDEHREALNSITNYENALAGISKKTAKELIARQENDEDPYCITYVDSYSQKDLETIVGNVEREKAFQFTYAAKSTAAAKK